MRPPPLSVRRHTMNNWIKLAVALAPVVMAALEAVKKHQEKKK